MNRNAAFGVGALLGAAAAIVWGRRSRLRVAPGPAPEARQRELREKLAGAQQAETHAAAADVPSPAAQRPKAPEPPPPAPPPSAEPPPSQPRARPSSPPGPPPADEFEAMRRRIHQEGKAAAEEMRRGPDEDS